MIPLYDLGPLGSPKYHQQSQNNWKYNKYSQCTIFSIFPGNVHQRCRFYTTPWFIHHSHVFITYGVSRTALNSVFRNLFIYSVRPYVPIWKYLLYFQLFWDCWWYLGLPSGPKSYSGIIPDVIMFVHDLWQVSCFLWCPPKMFNNMHTLSWDINSCCTKVK
jgi:hypothetical protein